MEKRPNFYIILELDPSITNWSTIEATITKKHRSWAIQKNQESPTARRKAERYMKFLPEMKSLLKQTESCKQEAKAAVQELKKEKQAQLKKLDQLIFMLHTTIVLSDTVKLLVRQSRIKIPKQYLKEGGYIKVFSKRRLMPKKCDYSQQRKINLKYKMP